MDIERWRWVPGFRGKYKISSFGRVYSVRRKKFLKLGFRDNGIMVYRTVCLQKYGRRWDYLVHRLVLLTFVGPCPLGMECRHLDGDSLNNHLDNVVWGTKKENGLDKRKHGRSKGENNHRAKFTNEEVLEIRRLHDNRVMTDAEISRRFKTTPHRVWTIVHRKSWTHI